MLGQLVVKLGLDAVEFTTGLTKAELQSKRFAREMQKNFDVIGQGITALGVGSVGLAVGLSSIIEKVAGFQDLSEKIGDTAVNVSSLKSASDQSGTSLDSIAAASVKLTKALSSQDEGSKGAAQAIKAIGLEFNSFKALSPVEQIDAVARALGGFEEGAEQTAIATALFGKSGADLLPFLKDLASQTERQATLTGRQIADSNEYAETLGLLRGQVGNLAQSVGADLAPQFTELVKLISDTIKYTSESSSSFSFLGSIMSGVKNIIQTLVIVGSDVAFVLNGVGREIGGIAAQAVALASLDIKGFNAISEAMKDDSQKARKELDKFQASVLAGASISTNLSVVGKRPRIDISGLATGGKKDSKNESVSDYERLNKQIQEAIGLENQQLELKRDLTKEELFLRKIRADAADSKIPLTVKQNKSLEENLAAFKSISDRVNAQERAIKTQNEYAELIAKNYEQEQKDIEAVSQARQKAEQQGIKSSQTQIKNLEFENSLMLLNSDQRQVAIALRDLENSGIDKQSEAYQNARVSIENLITEGQRLREVNKFFADLESASRTTFENILTNAKNPFGALKDLIKKELINALFELTAKKWIIDIQANIGGGASASKSGGGIFGTLLGAGLKLFGRANGGTTSPGGLYEVNERGTPEMFSVGGRDFLMAGNKAGMVTNGARAAQSPRASGGVTINQSFDNRGADPGSAARLQAVAERIKAETIAAVQAKANRGGSFARSLGRA